MADKMIAYCGLDCSSCDAYKATQAGDSDRLAQLAKEWAAEPEQLVCDGCKAGKRKSSHCKHTCKIRVCCLKKAVDSCAECEVFPCRDAESLLKNSPEAQRNLNLGKRLIAV